MTPKQNLIEALENREPGRTPFTIYDWEMDTAVTSDDVALRMQDPEWRRLLNRGLTVRHHCNTLRAVEHGVTNSSEDEKRDGATYHIETKTTPAGSIRKITRDGWHYEDWLKSPEDYKIQQWIVEHTELIPDYDAFHRAEEVVGDAGIVVVTGAHLWSHRTPAMSINVDWAGTEQFCLDVAGELPELHALYEAAEKLFLEEQRLLAAGPGRYVVWFENLTISMLGPKRYEELLLSVYGKAVPIIQAGDKRVFVHYDGEVGLIADMIATAPFHGIDSLTEPPEGDLLYDQYRAAWPDKVLWSNINVANYDLPEDELRREVTAKRERAGKRGVAFEVSEKRPENWRHSFPIVLETLERLG